MGKVEIAKILSFGRPGDRIWVQVGTRRMTAIAATEINSAQGFVATDDQGQARVWCETHPTELSQRVGEFFKSKPETKAPLNLDAAILYAMRETKSSSVNFVNPTWEITGTGDSGFICVPRPEGDRGEYPDASTCIQFANQYWQEVVNNIDSLYDAEYLAWQDAITARDDVGNSYPLALSNYLNATTESPLQPDDVEFEPIVVTATSYVGSQPRASVTIVACDSYRYCTNDETLSYAAGTYRADVYYNRQAFIQNSTATLEAPQEPVRPANPPLPITGEASKNALSFYYQASLKSSPVKLIEINEEEAFEAIVIKDKSTSIALIKTGRIKSNEFVVDPGGSSSGGGGGGSWVVYDLESWYKMTSYGNLGQLQEENFYSSGYVNWSGGLTTNYQSWRYSGYSIYPLENGDLCSLGTDYLTYSQVKQRYETIAKYQNLTNMYKPKKQISAEPSSIAINRNSYNISGGSYQEAIESGTIDINLIAYNTAMGSGVCSRRKIAKKKTGLTLPDGVAFVIIKGILT